MSELHQRSHLQALTVLKKLRKHEILIYIKTFSAETPPRKTVKKNLIPRFASTQF